MKSILTKPVASSPVRQLVEWTPGNRRAAIQTADGGNLRLAADLVEACMGDDRVAGCLAARTRGLMGLPLQFEEGAGKSRNRKKAVKALEIEQDFWAAFPEAQLVQLLNWAAMLGVALGELIWERRQNRMIPRLKVWHPRWLRWDWDQRCWFVRQADGQELRVTPGDGKWVLLQPYGDERPWAFGAWRAVSTAWMAKYFALQDWCRHNEVHGSPVLVGKTPEGAAEDDWKGFANDLADLGGRTSIGCPPGYSVELAEAKATTFLTFMEQIQWADKAIAIALLGQNLTTEVARASMAAATIHQEVRQDFIRTDAETLASCLHDQALVWYSEFNFGDRDLAPWPCWDTTPPDDKTANAQMLATLGQALQLFRPQGIILDVPEILEKAKVPLLEIIEIPIMAVPNPANPSGFTGNAPNTGANKPAVDKPAKQPVTKEPESLQPEGNDA